jgi:hypothetical protein
MLATGIIERLTARGYQVCVVDPEGDYGTIPDIVHIGDGRHAPSVEEVAQLLEFPLHSVVANLLALPFDERPGYLTELCHALHQLNDRTGRPHWLVIDEAHHLLPHHAPALCQSLLADIPGLLLITVDPHHLSQEALEAVNCVISIDAQPSEVVRSIAEVQLITPPEGLPDSLPPGEGVIWNLADIEHVVQFSSAPCRSLHRRHRRKYAEGDMGWDRSFFFTGPEGGERLRAQNLIAFMDISDRIDDTTWLYHAHRGDYSRWIRDTIGDVELADQVARTEASRQKSMSERRAELRHAIEYRYTLPI